MRTGITHVLNLANDVTPINDAHSKERIDCVCVCVLRVLFLLCRFDPFVCHVARRFLVFCVLNWP